MGTIAGGIGGSDGDCNVAVVEGDPAGHICYVDPLTDYIQCVFSDFALCFGEDCHADIDIAIIVRSLSKELKNEIFNQVAEIELKYLRSISSIIFSETEFNRLKERERRVALDIESEGILL